MFGLDVRVGVWGSVRLLRTKLVLGLRRGPDVPGTNVLHSAAAAAAAVAERRRVGRSVLFATVDMRHGRRVSARYA